MDIKLRVHMKLRHVKTTTVHRLHFTIDCLWFLGPLFLCYLLFLVLEIPHRRFSSIVVRKIIKLREVVSVDLFILSLVALERGNFSLF